MANTWFRMYSEIRRDPKVRSMPETFQLKLIWLLTLRCEGQTEKMSRDELMYGLDCDETFLDLLHATFLAKGFIDKDWSVKHWNTRQYVSDSSTPRVHKHRAQQALKQSETFQKPLHETYQNRTEQIQNIKDKEQKPSPSAKKTALRRQKIKQASPPTKTDFAKARHREFKVAVFEYWRSKNPAVDCPWGAPEGQQLEIWLRACPNVTIHQFKEMLRNRFRSQVNHADRPSRWIKNVTSYANGPVNEFGKLETGNGQSTHRRNGNGKQDHLIAILNEADDSEGFGGDGFDAGSQPAHGNN